MARAESVIPIIELHLIGPLQSNKVREAVALFDVIHTVDRPKLAAALAEEMKPKRQATPSAGRGQYRRGAAEGRRASGGHGSLRRAHAATSMASPSTA